MQDFANKWTIDNNTICFQEILFFCNKSQKKRIKNLAFFGCDQVSCGYLSVTFTAASRLVQACKAKIGDHHDVRHRARKNLHGVTSAKKEAVVVVKLDDKIVTSPGTLCGAKEISLWQDMLAILFQFLLLSSFFGPVTLIVISFGLIYFFQWYVVFALYVLVYLLLALYPLQDWPISKHNKLFYNMFHYLSYKYAYHPHTADYISNHSKDAGTPPVIVANIPHGVVPFSTILSPILSPDLFNGNRIRGGIADAVFYTPLIRHVVTWAGMSSASKESLQNLLKQRENVGVIQDGIGGMFVSDSDERNLYVAILDKKGVAKLALETGCQGIVVEFFFLQKCEYVGVLFKAVFDKFGILKWLSRKVKASLLLFYGRFYLPIPRRVPCYFVWGPIVENKFANKPLSKPSQDQIDELHEKLLQGYQDIFELHKHVYGYSDKKLVCNDYFKKKSNKVAKSFIGNFLKIYLYLFATIPCKNKQYPYPKMCSFVFNNVVHKIIKRYIFGSRMQYVYDNIFLSVCRM
ncbi:hypothetical protein RFI_30874 [Reticulomyxa filosa]|uniref:Acyltransferase n=1 Tax=Reticulomyxa filosa TaxID=46433 RepID=X6M0L8_RETFI|nr:hypothetical protein RFI_30874 [Reticulomyxa filosa]|eukprot:ETO06520.1 hypothetical protein RFI_30874 [Reticulomyxa filosa]